MAQARRSRATLVLASILAIYALVRMDEVVAGSPAITIVALDVLSALAFALVDGAHHYGWRGILVFAAICTVIGNAIENLGIATGFPFGHYEFLDVMGPRVYHVPALLGLAYTGMAYVSWMLARLILGNTRSRLVALPAVASLIMVTWDWAQDPVWATLLHAWRWRDGGSWFGVPFSNFFGWYFTVFLIYLAFAEYVRRRPEIEPVRESACWPPVLFYAVCAAGNALQVFAHVPQSTVVDAAGKSWRAADILAASALVSVFAMGGFVFAASRKLVALKAGPSLRSG